MPKLKFIPIDFKLLVKAMPSLAIGLLLTAVIVTIIRDQEKKQVELEFKNKCEDTKLHIEARLKMHANLLLSGASFFAASDTISRHEWYVFNSSKNIELNIPGIQGIGYAMKVNKNDLKAHEEYIREEGFPNYKIYPGGDRDFYTSILFLEPFAGRNLKAFGYDMYSEPTRRKAMELSRDLNKPILSGKVRLVQESSNDVQSGTLMYVPIYRNGMGISTVEQRRAALKGWVYSPYRMRDLIHGILGDSYNTIYKKIKIDIYDGLKVNNEALLFSNNIGEKRYVEAKLNHKIKINFNSTIWTLVFSQNSDGYSFLTGKILLVLISGLIISLLFYVLTVLLFISRNSEKEILALNSKLKSMIDDKDKFISVLAHDLRAPFNSIIGFSSLLVDNVRNMDIDSIEKQVGIINASANNTFHLLEDLLTWVRAESGKIPFEPVTIMVSDLVSDLQKGLLPLAQAKSIKLIFDYVSWVSIFADLNMMKTILRNLITNAIKFSYPNSEVVISIVVSKNKKVIRVIDYGVGMDKEAVSLLFHRSHLYSTPGTLNEKGTGFGLLLCREFLEKHSSELVVKGELGKGCEFSFEI